MHQVDRRRQQCEAGRSCQVFPGDGNGQGGIHLDRRAGSIRGVVLATCGGPAWALCHQCMAAAWRVPHPCLQAGRPFCMGVPGHFSPGRPEARISATSPRTLQYVARGPGVVERQQGGAGQAQADQQVIGEAEQGAGAAPAIGIGVQRRPQQIGDRQAEADERSAGPARPRPVRWAYPASASNVCAAAPPAASARPRRTRRPLGQPGGRRRLSSAPRLPARAMARPTQPKPSQGRLPTMNGPAA
ncbi:Uncharacterised protein [Pseudomonas aeruginosa]|nr:Uncharacterised protein [Pseudomonas aeruginosa]